MPQKPRIGDAPGPGQLLPGQTRPDIIDRLADRMEASHADPGAKWGAGHAAGMFRAGLKELSQVLPAFPDGVRPVEEPGIAGNATNIEVVNAKENAATPANVTAHGPAAEAAAPASARAAIDKAVAAMSPELREVAAAVGPPSDQREGDPLERMREGNRQRAQEPQRGRERGPEK